MRVSATAVAVASIAGCGRLGFDAGFAPSPSWLRHVGNTSLDIGRALAVGDDGALYLTGEVDLSVDFGSGPIAASTDPYLAIYERDGTLRTAVAFSTTAYSQGNGIAVDHDGTTYVTGIGAGTVDLGGTPQSSAGGTDVFVASFTAAGSYRWSRFGGGPADDGGRSVAIDADGNIYVTGYFQQTIDLGAPLTSAGGTDVFVTSFTRDGVHRWSRRFGSALDDQPLAIAVSTDRVWVTGTFQGTLDIGTPPPTSAGAGDIFLASLGLDGSPGIVRGYGSSLDDGAAGVAVLGSGDVVFGGFAGGTIDFGGGPRVVGAAASAFVASVSSSGSHRWSKVFATASPSDVRWVMIDRSDVVHVSGESQAPIDFGRGPVGGAGGYDIFEADLTAAGDLLASVAFGGPLDDEGIAVAANAAGNVAVAGVFRGTADFGALGTVTSAGDADIYLLQLEP